ncbi:MAG: orotate phosphoribosyltransferase [Legionella sp.]|nr:orotate phosphoribosyltransferase [Legionella sp.]
MNQIKASLIKLALNCGVLQFGEFTLKSGRVSPYFFNAGLFYSGSALAQLGKFYASILLDNQIQFDHLFGPAYKGLPLATTAAVALAARGKDTTVTFDRKEAKNHGEGGELIGAPLWGKTVIIDDVITAGTAFRASKKLINAQGGQLTGVIIILDRCERGESLESTLSEIMNDGIEVYSMITLFDLIDYLKNNHHSDKVKQLEAYLGRYGCTKS